MKDVAERAGVSAQTVSRVLSGHPNVHETTRQLVLQAVAELGYRRNLAARALSSGRSRTIGVVQLATGNYSAAVLAVGIERAARTAGFTVSTVIAEHPTAAATADAMQRLAEQRVEGIVLAMPLADGSPHIESIASNTPTVTIDGSSSDLIESVALDQADAAALATTHLLELGHATVWHLAGAEGWIDSSQRISGWRDTLKAAHRVVPEPFRGDWSPESGYQAGLRIAAHPEITALFVASDEMAFGVIRALHERGRSVPDDVSVVGMDDIALAAYGNPALTTVRQPFEEIGRCAVRNLLRRIATGTATGTAADEHHPERLSPTLIIRSSTAAPPLKTSR